ncbi:MAG: hypothetical protein CL692_04025 [Cellvibrionales bacterium]|nr:hypothetical protein [Cellvibrionales bacterium]HCH20534.1 hypothetical protein [Cellvibrionales bacterium]
MVKSGSSVITWVYFIVNKCQFLVKGSFFILNDLCRVNVLLFLARFKPDNAVIKRSIKPIALILSCLLLASCSSLKVELRDWPANWPSESYFQAVYDRDQANQADQSYAEYIVWVKRFYSGWVFYPSGWDGMVEQLLATKEDPVLQAWFRQEMLALGARISSEWAKDDNHRLINSRHLLNWSDAVRRSVAQGQEEWLLAEINQDVAGLLNGSITASSIEEKRYFSRSSDGDERDDEFDF